jgi:hypothetical protein
MKNILLTTFLLLPVPVSAQEVYKININRVCAAIVQIPYASDNFTDKEFEQFKTCLQFMKQYEEP